MARILKADKVRIDGKCLLGGVASQPQVQADLGHVRPAVEVLQTTEKYTLLEVICGCGQKLVIRCEHG